MTDGIIQEVLNTEIKFWTQQKSMCAGIITNELSRIRQELIEKIKQSIEYHEGCYHIQRGCSLKTDLIGDNQE